MPLVLLADKVGDWLRWTVMKQHPLSQRQGVIHLQQQYKASGWLYIQLHKNIKLYTYINQHNLL